MRGILSARLHGRSGLSGTARRLCPVVLIALLVALPQAQARAWAPNMRVSEAPPAAASGAYSQVSAGAYFTCVLKTDDTPACWGDYTFRQTYPPLGSLRQISAGFYHACAIRPDGSLTCWGYDGNGETDAPGGAFSQVSAGFAHTCGLRTDGTIACWGNDSYGQRAAPPGTFRQVSAGFYHTCALTLDGSVSCWGYDGDGETDAPTGSFSQVSAGDEFTCGIRTSGAIACWGDDTYGQNTVHMVPFVRLVASANPLPAGQALTLTAAVTPSFNTGGVTFYDGATPLDPLGAAVHGGVATFTLPITGTGSLAPGVHALTAEYTGSESYQTASSPTLEEVVRPR